MRRNKHETESDVEQKFIFGLLTNPGALAIPEEWIKPKHFLQPTVLDKRAGKTGGYYPDYSIWLHGHPLLIIEAKDASVSVDVGFREAALYARHLNSLHPTDRNPCRFIVATNGELLFAGYWDQQIPVLSLEVDHLRPGTSALGKLIEFMGSTALHEHAARVLASMKIERGTRPFNLAGGQALLASKKPLNTFAADLSPALRKYFSSTGEEYVTEIMERGYVSSEETTGYDRVLEALLKDRANPRRDSIVKVLAPHKGEELNLTETIRGYGASSSKGGHLQIIQGSVGSGKSLFIRRYQRLLQPSDIAEKTLWSFINFNESPPSLDNAEDWLQRTFVESLSENNAALDIYNPVVLKGIFAKRISQRRGYYEQLKSISEAEETRARAKDMVVWQENYIELAEGLSAYIVGQIGKSIVAVFDNVDKLDLDNQLKAFQLALWFMSKTKSFVILQMRDETYERFKNIPPLDTYRTGITFHLTPPRFVDVVKRRLELAIEYISENSPSTREYSLDTGQRIKIPTSDLGLFLNTLYSVMFSRRNNVSRLLEALSGRDVRQALDMFVSIVTSGHLSTTQITSEAKGFGLIRIQEHNIIKILMRTDYRFFSDSSGFVHNIFYYSNDWTMPDNFILVEVLFYLILNRKRTGQIGLEGYFTIDVVADHMELIGYDREDAIAAMAKLLEWGLVVADDFNSKEVSGEKSIKILAAGFMHLRVLSERIEYLYGVLVTTPVSDAALAGRLAAVINLEGHTGDVSASRKASAVRDFLTFLKLQAATRREKNPFYSEDISGTAYVISSMQRSLDRFYGQEAAALPSELDL